MKADNQISEDNIMRNKREGVRMHKAIDKVRRVWQSCSGKQIYSLNVSLLYILAQKGLIQIFLKRYEHECFLWTRINCHVKHALYVGVRACVEGNCWFVYNFIKLQGNGVIRFMKRHRWSSRECTLNNS